MKRKLSLLLVLAMAVTAVPMTAFAASENRVSRVVTAEKDANLDSYLYIKNKGDFTGDYQEFTATLANAEWNFTADDKGKKGSGSSFAENANIYAWGKVADGFDGTTPGSDVDAVVYKVSAKEAIFRFYKVDATLGSTVGTDKGINLPLLANLTDKGDATVTIDPMDSNLSGGTYTIAAVSSNGTKTTIEKTTDISESGNEKIKPITVSEITAGSIENGTVKLKVNGNFTFNTSKTPTVAFVGGNSANLAVSDIKVDDDEITFKVTGAGSTTATKLVISDIVVEEDDADAGDIGSITVSGANIDKTTLDVAKFVDYGFSFKAEEEDVPVIYSGRENGDTDLLKVTFKETAPDSWFTDRKLTLTLPDGVKFKEVPDQTDEDNIDTKGDIEIDSKDRKVANISGYKVTDSKKGELELEFAVETSPDFTGDLDVTLGGPGVEGELSATIAKVVAPVTVTAAKTDVSIDYRNTEVADITITENEAGALEKDSTLTLSVDKMTIESGIDYEVVEGDIKIDKVEKKDGTIKIKIKSESSKTPGVIKIKGIKLYLERSLPAGDYALKLVANDSDGYDYTKTGSTDYAFDYDESEALFRTNNSDAKDKTPGFDVDSITVVKDYVRVVTAGRDQDDSTFTTKIAVTIGADTLTAGDKTIALDVPAYIANGYTMLPVRAVTEALSGVAIVRWDDATKTAIITFGSRIVSMSVGKNTMSINGVEVAMQAAPEITNERIFIPLRDLGYALGLNDSKINWDDATKTATLN